MTTAHRPTWKAAVGRAQEGGWGAGGALSTATSVLDAPAHTKLKVRTGDQTVADRRAVLAESLRKLEEVDRKAGALRGGVIGRRDVDPKVEEESRRRLLKQTADVDEEKLLAKYDDADDDFGNKSDDGGGGGWSDVDDDDGGGGAVAGGGNNAAGADESDSDLDASDSDDSDEDESDDEDEEAALQAELAKIRAEREEVRAREEAEEKAHDEARMEEAALMGNPLLAGEGASVSSSGGGGRMKRRWNDDVVFRNQARGEPEQNKKRFINDTVRNDFHKRFLNKFVR